MKYTLFVTLFNFYQVSLPESGAILPEKIRIVFVAGVATAPSPWDLPSLSGRLIISTEQTLTSIYLSTFPNAQTSKKAQNHMILYLLNIELAISLLIGRKRTVNFRNQRL